MRAHSVLRVALAALALVLLTGAATKRPPMQRRPLPAVVGEADVIVLGAPGPVGTSPDDPGVERATIHVEHVLHPAGLGADTLIVEWNARSPVLRDVFSEAGSAIWLLASARDGRFRARWQCRQPVELREDVERFRDLRISAEIRDHAGAAVLRVRVQNLSGREWTFPAVRRRPDGGYVHGPRLAFEMTTGTLAVSPGSKLALGATVEPLVLEPFRVGSYTLPLEEVYAMGGLAPYELRIRLDGRDLFGSIRVKDAH